MYNNFQEAYLAVLSDVYSTGNRVTVRGNDMIEKIPVYFEILNPRDRLLNFECRPTIPRYSFGELLWYLRGSDDTSFIDKYSKQWMSLSDDGLHSNSAYGKYIFGSMPNKGYGVVYDYVYFDYVSRPENFGCQWDYVKETLRKDPYSRQAVIHIKPIQMYDTKDITCTYCLQFFIRDNKLDMVVLMRSNDLLRGTTFDVFMFTFMQELMAAELGVELGVYKHMSVNMHIYLNDEQKIQDILDEPMHTTKQFHKIPSDFRKKDLPILLDIEKDFWSNDKQLTPGGIAKAGRLSELGKDLLDLLCKWR